MATNYPGSSLKSSLKGPFLGLFALLFASQLVCHAQQDPLFTQYMMHPFTYNPAAAGSTAGLDVVASARMQWVGLEGAPQSQVFSGHMPLYGLSSGAGLSIVNDFAGAERTTMVTAAYSYILELGKKTKLSIGVSAGFAQKSLDGQKLRAVDGVYEGSIIIHNDDFLPITTTQDLAADFGAGLWLSHSGLELGISATHLTEPNVTYDLGNGSADVQFSRHYYATAGYKFQAGDNIKVKPGAIYRTDLTTWMVDLNTLIYYQDNIWAGASFRTYFGEQTDAIGGIVGVQITNRFGAGYSYDYTMSTLGTVSSGSHEIMLRYVLAVEKPRPGKRINNLRYLDY